MSGKYKWDNQISQIRWLVHVERKTDEDVVMRTWKTGVGKHRNIGKPILMLRYVIWKTRSRKYYTIETDGSYKKIHGGNKSTDRRSQIRRTWRMWTLDAPTWSRERAKKKLLIRLIWRRIQFPNRSRWPLGASTALQLTDLSLTLASGAMVKVAVNADLWLHAVPSRASYGRHSLVASRALLTLLYEGIAWKTVRYISRCIRMGGHWWKWLCKCGKWLPRAGKHDGTVTGICISTVTITNIWMQ